MPSGREYEGVAICSPADNFSRKVGRTWALSRALASAQADIMAKLRNNVGNTASARFIVDCNGICTSLWPDPWCPKHGREGWVR